MKIPTQAPGNFLIAQYIVMAFKKPVTPPAKPAAPAPAPAKPAAPAPAPAKPAAPAPAEKRTIKKVIAEWYINEQLSGVIFSTPEENTP